MKKILAIFAIIAAGALYASDRAEIIREKIEAAPETRAGSARVYNGESARLRRISRAASVAQTNGYEPSIEETRILLWREAIEECPELVEARENCDPATRVWYAFKALDNSKDNLEFMRNLEKIKKLIK